MRSYRARRLPVFISCGSMESGLRIMRPFFSCTENFVPSSRPSFFRIAAGMITRPLVLIVTITTAASGQDHCRRRRFRSNKETPRRQADGALRLFPAMTYSPTKFPSQYHRRVRTKSHPSASASGHCIRGNLLGRPLGDKEGLGLPILASIFSKRSSLSSAAAWSRLARFLCFILVSTCTPPSGTSERDICSLDKVAAAGQKHGLCAIVQFPDAAP